MQAPCETRCKTRTVFQQDFNTRHIHTYIHMYIHTYIHTHTQSPYKRHIINPYKTWSLPLGSGCRQNWPSRSLRSAAGPVLGTGEVEFFFPLRGLFHCMRSEARFGRLGLREVEFRRSHSGNSGEAESLGFRVSGSELGVSSSGS